MPLLYKKTKQFEAMTKIHSLPYGTKLKELRGRGYKPLTI